MKDDLSVNDYFQFISQKYSLLKQCINTLLLESLKDKVKHLVNFYLVTI